jgi:hypothetical protein
MATNQPLSHLDSLPVIETVLKGALPVILAERPRNADEQANQWKSLRERIAAWAPADSEPDERIDEDGYRMPARGTVSLALQIVARLGEGWVTAPGWVVQDGNGGIDFEWKDGDRAETLSINAQGQMELMKFERSKLVSRKPISWAAVER